LPEDEFAIFGSGCLAIRGKKEAKDLDLVVLPELWEVLAKKYPVAEGGWGPKAHLTENIEAIDKPAIGFSASEVIKGADIFDGIRFVKLEVLREWKIRLGREKDLADIKLIDKLISDEKNGR